MGLLSSTLLLLDARTRPVLWCLVPTVVSFPSELFQLLLPLLRSLLWRRQGSRGRCLVFLPHPRLLAPWLRPPCLQLRSLRLCRSLRLLWTWPPLRLLRQEEEGGNR